APTAPTPAAAASASSWFRSRRPSGPVTAGHRPGPAAPRPGGNGFGPPGRWADQQHAAQILTDPVRADRTVAGMPVRVPRANLLRGSADAGQRPASGGPTRPGAGPGTPPLTAPAAARSPQRPPERSPERSPEKARSLLSGFQRGAGRAAQRAPAPGEGADH
ncbi:MAG: hypothetical protein JO016_02515, partial [Actinobacteria bacterium]|nr:hypothetical protein [Actinomycetota bacterium]